MTRERQIGLAAAKLGVGTALVMGKVGAAGLASAGSAGGVPLPPEKRRKLGVGIVLGGLLPGFGLAYLFGDPITGYQLLQWGFWIGGIGGAAGLLVFGLTGVVVAYHQPRNPVGWSLIVFALLFVLGTAAQAYAVLRYHLGHSGLPFGSAAVLIAPVTALSFFVLPLAILFFPDGQLARRRWRWVLWAYVACGAAEAISEFAPAVAAVAAHDIRASSSGDLSTTANLPGWLTHPPVWVPAFW